MSEGLETPAEDPSGPGEPDGEGEEHEEDEAWSPALPLHRRPRGWLWSDDEPPTPFERVARGGVLALLLPLVHGPFLLGERGPNAFALSFFALLVGLLATPCSFVEAWLAKRGWRARAAALVWLPAALLGGAVLVVAQVIFTLALVRGGSREGALGEALRFLRRLGHDLDKIAVFLLPLALALTFYCMARVARLRWRWALLGVTPSVLAISFVLVEGSGSAGPGRMWTTLAGALSVSYPLAAIAAARLERRRQARWAG